MPAAAATNTLTMTSSSPITAGAVLKNYTWDISDGMVKAAVLEIDLTNPYVQLEVVPGKGKFTQRSTVSAMANRTDAIAMVNGDFYNMAVYNEDTLKQRRSSELLIRISIAQKALKL